MTKLFNEKLEQKKTLGTQKTKTLVFYSGSKKNLIAVTTGNQDANFNDKFNEP